MKYHLSKNLKNQLFNKNNLILIIKKLKDNFIVKKILEKLKLLKIYLFILFKFKNLFLFIYKY